MTKYNIPKREYCHGTKKMVSMRLPERLMHELERLAKDNGWTTTDLVCTVLDQYIQFDKKVKNNK